MREIILNKNNLPVIGISSCLLKGGVRYDGKNKQDVQLSNKLSKHALLIDICPEVECGFPVPREAVILTGDQNNPRFITKNSKIDYTNKMNTWCIQKIDFLKYNRLHGFIFKSKSPSCAIKSVKLYDLQNNIISKQGTGLFAKKFIQNFPDIPVIEESALTNPDYFSDFIKRANNLR